MKAIVPPSAEAGEGAGAGASSKKPLKKKRHIWRKLGVAFLVLVFLLLLVRLAMPPVLRWYVNRTIDQSPLYDGQIGQIHVNLWRGAYSIDDIRLNKTTGNVPVPLFSAKRLDLAIQWDALLHGKIVGRVLMDHPELNFVDSKEDATSQDGTGGPWMDMLNQLFPFKINRAIVRDGSIHFRAFDRNPPVDIFFSEVDATVDDLTNVKNQVTPMMATVKATALAMDQAKFEFEMKFDPFSYKPTLEMAVRLIGLDVTKLNQFAKAYGGIDFESGFFDLVVEVNAREGLLNGYVKPLFRHLKVATLQDLTKKNPLEIFWEAVVGVTVDLLKNQPRDQLATEIPLSGDLSAPGVNVVAVVMNVLRNAFIRAYLPKLQGVTPDINHLEFGKGSITEPTNMGTE